MSYGLLLQLDQVVMYCAIDTAGTKGARVVPQVVPLVVLVQQLLLQVISLGLRLVLLVILEYQ